MEEINRKTYKKKRSFLRAVGTPDCPAIRMRYSNGVIWIDQQRLVDAVPVRPGKCGSDQRRLRDRRQTRGKQDG
jgi:hypothetical protein